MITEFPQEVVEEATKLRTLLTEEEKARLNINFFKPDEDTCCIYGLATGHCHSERADELIKAACERVYKAVDYPGRTDISNINGSPKDLKRGMRYQILFRTDYWSPIEVFITQTTKENNHKLIKFIKGDLNSLQ